MCKAGSNAFDTDGDAMTFSGTELEFDHFPGAEHTGCQPKVVVLVPVLLLAGPQLGTESCRTNFAILVKREAILQKLPSSVNDLRTSLALNWLLHTWNFVRDDADVGRVLPPLFPIDLHPLLGVDDIVMDDARDVHLVGLCSIGVRSYVSVRKPMHTRSSQKSSSYLGWGQFGRCVATCAWTSAFWHDERGEPRCCHDSSANLSP